MYSVHSTITAIFLCFITMLGWGSWANTLKIANKHGWPFELFYWDYVIGMAGGCVVFALTLGSHGQLGTGVVASIAAASTAALFAAFLSGVIFNASNVLIVIATDLAGIAISFPVAIGLAVVIGTVVSYRQSPTGHAVALFSGLALMIVAMLLSTLASNLLSGSVRLRSLRGVIFAVASGCIMGFFYPRLAYSIASTSHAQPGKLTPYAAALVFTVGLLLSNVVINTLMISARGETYRHYFAGNFRLHLAGFAGGAIWMTALILNLLAASVAGPAVSYALGQGATLVAAIWGVFVWHEFRGASRSVGITLSLMFLSYAAGLLLIGTAAF